MSLESLKALQSLAQNELNEANERKNNEGGDRIPLVYPVHNGVMRLKFLFKEEAGIVQKKIIRHNIGKEKIACMSMYGEDCPICNEIRRVEDQYGKDCGVYSKYGYKVRGISYAVLVDYDDGMFSESNDPKKGDLILFMYPPSLYNEINNIIVRSGENIESLIASNYGKTIEIKRSQKIGGYPEYSINVYPYGEEKIKETDEEWEEFVNNIPNLKDSMTPANPTEELREKVKAAVEAISVEYASNNVMNPNDKDEDSKVTNVENKNENNGKPISSEVKDESEDIPINKPEPEDSTSSGNPSCFGCHSDTENKCLICPVEADCILG